MIGASLWFILLPKDQSDIVIRFSQSKFKINPNPIRNKKKHFQPPWSLRPVRWRNHWIANRGRNHGRKPVRKSILQMLLNSSLNISNSTPTSKSKNQKLPFVVFTTFHFFIPEKKPNKQTRNLHLRCNIWLLNVFHYRNFLVNFEIRLIWTEFQSTFQLFVQNHNLIWWINTSGVVTV